MKMWVQKDEVNAVVDTTPRQRESNDGIGHEVDANEIEKKTRGVGVIVVIKN